MNNGTCSVDGCATTERARGLCRKHYQRWHRFGTTDKKRGTPEERFWSMVQKTEDCWWWTGTLTFGYGSLGIGAEDIRAHRFSYELANGPIPDGMWVDHRCHNPTCVRPDHLRLATPKQNGENRRGAQTNSKTGVRGVSIDARSGKYVAVVNHNGKRHYVGKFDSLFLAESAVVGKRNELFTHNDTDRQAV